MKATSLLGLSCLAFFLLTGGMGIRPAAAQADPPHQLYLPAILKSCPGKCYYVSNSTGSDANPGTDAA